MMPEISASKVAGFIGLHKFQNTNEMYYELLRKSKEGLLKIQKIEEDYHRRSFNSVLNEVLKDQPIQDCISSAIKELQSTTEVSRVLSEVEAQAALILDLRRDNFTPQLRNQLACEIRGRVTKRRGIENEEKILNDYETAREVKVQDRNTKILRKDYGIFKLVGKIDGFVASENRIVDSKERTRFWPNVPLYDEIQLRCYMDMTGATESELIERFPDGQTRHTKFLNDPEKWRSIQTAIERGVEILNNALDNPEELKRIVFANTICTQANGSKNPRITAPRVDKQEATIDL
jgi:hypothetical protein